MDAALEKADLKDTFPSDFSRERICIYDNQGNQFLSVFYHIRNAFTHCRLNMVDVDGECVFILEDVQPKQKERWRKQNGERKRSLHTALTLLCRTSFPCRRTSSRSSGKRQQNIRISYDLVGFIPLNELMKEETA